MTKLKEFLKDHIAKSNQNITHTNLNSTGGILRGKYNIPQDFFRI